MLLLFVIDWNNFEYQYNYIEDEDEDEDILALDDNLSSTTTVTNVDSFTTESSNYNEILPFVWNDIAFRKAQLLSEAHNDDKISWNDIDTNLEENYETESIATKLTETENEVNYQINNDNDNDNDQTSDLSLTPCVILDIIDGQIECCFKKSVRPLAQLIGTWEINENIVTNTKAENKLYTLGVCSSHFNFV